ncbi:MAG: YdcH family protein [Acetobacteraceae bacterium]|nr:YdcH family protein [Acetobacteraceae bacterium]
MTETTPPEPDAGMVRALEARHAEFERMLGEELARPMPDETVVKRLKHEKLAIRDRLAGMAAATGRPSRLATA